MKIGILTASYAPNYGALLQCYALQQYLTQRGENVEVIDYVPDVADLHWSTFPFRAFSKATLKGKLTIFSKFLLFLPFRLRRQHKFSQFVNKYLKLSKHSYKSGVVSFDDRYDIYIIGSDQMWSKNIFEMDPVYWGNFEKKQGERIVSYAVSCGSTDQFNRDDEIYIKKSLANFSFISVREDVLARYIEGLTSLPVATVLDPTLMLKKEAYDALAVKPSIKEEYVLIYRIGDNSLIDEMAEIASKHYGGVKIVEIGNSMITHRLRHPHYKQCTPSICEFLGYFKYAKCIFSRSFHGLVFSLMFRRQFYVGESDIMDRVNNLLDIIGLKNRVINRQNIHSMKFEEIDYESVERKLLEKSIESAAFIDKILEC